MVANFRGSINTQPPANEQRLFTRRKRKSGLEPGHPDKPVLSFPGEKTQWGTRPLVRESDFEGKDRNGNPRGPGSGRPVTPTTSGPLAGSRPEGLVSAPDDQRLRATVQALAKAGGDSVVAILLYGSHLQASSPNRWSAYDFFLVTDSYSRFYGRLKAGGHHSRPPWLLTGLSHVLPPNVISFDRGRPDEPPAKCAVLSPRHLRRSLRPFSPDHFIKGRVVQKLALVWSRGPEEEEMIVSALREAREDILRWVKPFLPRPFTVEEFAERMLRVSYRGEIRPESPDRVVQVFQSQRETLVNIARESLALAVRKRKVLEESGTYRWVRPPTRASWAFYSLYFFGSKARATARWFKYMLTFDGWLDYIQRKIERRAGMEVQIEERERRWPLIFLWPKLFLVLRNVRNRRAAQEQEDEGTGS